MKVLVLKIKKNFKNLYMILKKYFCKKKSSTEDLVREIEQRCIFCPDNFKCDCYIYGRICSGNKYELCNEINYKKRVMGYDECGCDDRDLSNKGEYNDFFL